VYSETIAVYDTKNGLPNLTYLSRTCPEL